MGMIGKIVKGIAGFYYVDCGEHIYECRAKGVFRSKKIKPLVGDDVEISSLGEDPFVGNIERILERRNELVRPAVANVDQAAVVFAVADPVPNLNLLDRFLVTLCSMGLPAIIVFSKSDLDDGEKMEGLRVIYEPAGYPVIPVSTCSGEGINKLSEALAGKTTVLAGPSGVGKSSLTNLLMPRAHMETGSVSEKIRRGKHTTRHSELFGMGNGTYLMDTPGFSSMYVDGMEAGQIKDCFPEFSRYEKNCRFAGCVHIGEKECGVKRAAEEGRISRSRYENYRMFYSEQKEKRRY